MGKKIISLFTAIIIILCFGGCGNTQTNDNTNTGADTGSQPASAATADTLTIAVNKDQNSMTPFTYVNTAGLVFNRLIYDTLFIPDLEDNIVPWMVEDDYTINDNYRSYTFTLLEGQKFHDGTALTTEDVEFSFTYPANQNAASYRKICSNVDSFEIEDDRTMTIKLINTDVNFLRSGLAAMRIISKAQYEGVEDGTTVTDTLGSGMYKLEEYKVGEYYVLKGVEDYFKGTPKVKTINMPIMEDDSAIQSAILSGNIAATNDDINTEMLEVFNKADGIEIFASDGYAPMMMNINNGIEPFSDINFRIALTYAIDVNGIMNTLYGQYATAGTKGIIRPDMPFSVSGLEYVYDEAKANEILDTAGYDIRNGNGVRLTPNGEECSFEILSYSGSAYRIRAAELISEQLKKVGIETTVKVMEMDTVDAYVWPDFEVSKGRDYDLAMWGWGTSINPDFLVNQFCSDYTMGPHNVCGYVNPEVDLVIEEQYINASSEEQLYKALEEIQRLIAEDPAMVCFGYADVLQACNTSQYDGFKAGKGANVINVFSFLDI